MNDSNGVFRVRCNYSTTEFFESPLRSGDPSTQSRVCFGVVVIS